MHTLVLCLWVLGIVSAEDDQAERPVYIISQKGSPPGYSNGQPFFGAPVSSNNVKVLPNAYKTPQDFEQSRVSADPVSVPVIVNRNTPLQGNTNQPIPVPVAYPDDGSRPNGQSQPALEYNPLPIRRPPFPGVTPVPVLVKAPAAAYRNVASTPRPFQTSKSQFAHKSSSENPYSAISPSFRLWPKLPEPVPVPVLTADTFVRDFYRNLIPQNLHKLPIGAPQSSNSFKHNLIPVRYPDNSQVQPQPGQSANQGPIYIIVPATNNNAQSGSYQTQNQPSYQQSQAPQSGQRIIILAPPSANSQPDQAYQTDRYSSNTYFGSQQQGQLGQLPLNYAAFGLTNAPGSQTQAQTGQQDPLNYAVFAPSNAPNSQQHQSGDQQSSFKYAIFGQRNEPGSQVPKSVEQAPQNYIILAPAYTPGAQSSNTAQSPLNYGVFGSTSGGSSFSPSTSSPSQYFGFSSTPSPSPQYEDYSSRQSTPFAGYSSTQVPLQYSGYSSSQSPSQFSGYSSSTQSPQYIGYSTTPASSQTDYSQSNPVSRVSFSGAGSSYSYSIK